MKLFHLYSGVYSEFIKNSFAEALSFRMHFVLLIFMDLFFYFSILGSVEFLFHHIDKIGPWNRTDFMFFIAFMIAIDHLHMTFISANFWKFSFDLRTGNLDFILLKPLNSLFIIFFQRMRPATLINGFLPWGYLLYFGLAFGLNWWQWILLPFLVLLGLTLMVSLEILMSMSMFWTIESMGVNFLRLQIQTLARWPNFIYQYYAQKFFSFVVPVLLVGSAPIHFLKSPQEWGGLLWMVFFIGLSWGLTGFFWKQGLRSYESASS